MDAQPGLMICCVCRLDESGGAIGGLCRARVCRLLGKSCSLWSLCVVLESSWSRGLLIGAEPRIVVELSSPCCGSGCLRTSRAQVWMWMRSVVGRGSLLEDRRRGGDLGG